MVVEEAMGYAPRWRRSQRVQEECEKIYAILQEGGLSAGEVSEKMGMDIVTTRNRLHKMKQLGLLVQKDIWGLP